MQGIIVTTPSDLKKLISEAVKEELQNIIHNKTGRNSQSSDGDELLTRKETASILNVTLPTLTKYVRSGKIKCHKIGRRVLFKKSDILNSISPQNK